MKRLLVAACVLGILLQFSHGPEVIQEVEAAPSLAQLVVKESAVPSLTARAYGVFDLETGELLFSQNVDEPLPIASVTKLFTAAAVLESGKGVDEVVIAPADVATEGRAGKLEVGQQYTLHELLFPLLLESSNDAAAAIARDTILPPVVGVALADTSGLSPDNRATVEGLAMAVRALYIGQPHVFDITTLPQAIGDYTGWVNNSPVRDLPGYRGGKHGYTEAAGRTLAAVFAESTLGNREFGYIILGSKDLRSDTLALRAAVESAVRVD